MISRLQCRKKLTRLLRAGLVREMVPGQVMVIAAEDVAVGKSFSYVNKKALYC